MAVSFPEQGGNVLNKTRIQKTDTVRKILVDIEELKFMLSCGRQSAAKIGEEAGAKLYVGRRVLWNVVKIEEYLKQQENGAFI